MFLIAGGFNLVWGLVALGVSLGGTDHTVLGDLSVHNLEGLGAVGVIVSLIDSMPAPGSSSAAPALRSWASFSRGSSSRRTSPTTGSSTAGRSPVWPGT
jgi:hypothetical protein